MYYPVEFMVVLAGFHGVGAAKHSMKGERSVLQLKGE